MWIIIQIVIQAVILITMQIIAKTGQIQGRAEFVNVRDVFAMDWECKRVLNKKCSKILASFCW